MRRSLILASIASAAILSTSAVVAQDFSGKRITIALTGAEEPDGGDPDGSGTAMLRINPGQSEVCYTLTVSDIEPATMAHIHEAPVGVAGDVVVTLNAPTSGMSSGCASISRELALELIRSPEDYYVNVHNMDYPAGALRGQLSM